MGWFDFFFGRKSGDGSSPEKAVIVYGIAEEYKWVRANCPGFAPKMQALQTIRGRPYDVLTLQNDDGVERTVYFDISSFFSH